MIAYLILPVKYLVYSLLIPSIYFFNCQTNLMIRFSSQALRISTQVKTGFWSPQNGKKTKQNKKTSLTPKKLCCKGNLIGAYDFHKCFPVLYALCIRQSDEQLDNNLYTYFSLICHFIITSDSRCSLCSSVFCRRWIYVVIKYFAVLTNKATLGSVKVAMETNNF